MVSRSTKSALMQSDCHRFPLLVLLDLQITAVLDNSFAIPEGKEGQSGKEDANAISTSGLRKG